MLRFPATVIRAFKYTSADYEQLTTRLYREHYKVANPTPEMIASFVRTQKRNDRLISAAMMIIAVFVVYRIIWEFIR